MAIQELSVAEVPSPAHHPRNPGTGLELGWLRGVQANWSAIYDTFADSCHDDFLTYSTY